MVSMSSNNRNNRRLSNYYSFDLVKNVIDSKRVDLLEQFLKDGLDVELTNEYGESILEYAMDSYNLPIAFCLVKNGADPQPIIDNPLSDMVIIHDGDLDILKIAVAHGIDINRQSESGSTLLTLAIVDGKLDMIKYLIDHGADLSLTSWEGTYSQVNETFHKRSNIDLYYKIQRLINADRGKYIK